MTAEAKRTIRTVLMVERLNNLNKLREGKTTTYEFFDGGGDRDCAYFGADSRDMPEQEKQHYREIIAGIDEVLAYLETL